MSASFTRIQLENWLKTIDVKADNVLDIGGSQNIIKGRTKSFDVKEYKILDLEKPHELKQKPEIICDLNKRFEYIDNEDFIKNEKYFDIVFCMEVSEYFWNPFSAITNIKSLLKKGGILYISFSFIYPVHNPVDQDYLRYTPRGVFKLLKETGFEILEMKPRLESENSLLMPAFNIEGMRPAKGYNMHDCVGSLIKAKKK